MLPVGLLVISDLVQYDASPGGVFLSYPMILWVNVGSFGFINALGFIHIHIYFLRIDLLLYSTPSYFTNNIWISLWIHGEVFRLNTSSYCCCRIYLFYRCSMAFMLDFSQYYCWHYVNVESNIIILLCGLLINANFFALFDSFHSISI